jgi:hypothetical protein
MQFIKTLRTLTFDNTFKVVGAVTISRHISAQARSRRELLLEKIDLIEE